MAANNQIVKKSIQIDAGDTLRTVRSLKQEISDLRDQLLNLEQGTEEYDEAQRQLQTDVQDLTEVMGAHKQEADVLEGSYQDLQNQLKELKSAWKATNDEAERDVIGEKIRGLNDQLREMDASIGDFHRNVGNYQSAWGGLTGVMENGEKVTDDLEKGIKAFGAAVGLTENQVKGLSDVLKRLKDGFKITKDITKAKEESEKAATATSELATAEQAAAAQGTALATSQKATGAAAKTMAAGETTAAGATKGLSVAMKGLKAALISTGIGALVVALGELVNLLDKAFSKARQARIEAINAASKNLASTVTDQITNLGNLSDAREFDRRKMEAAGASELELLEKKKEDLQELSVWYKRNAEDAKEFYEAEKARVEALPRKRQEEHTEALENLKKTADEAAESVDNLEEEIQKTEQDIEIQKIKDAHKEVKSTGDELKKWADLVKDPKFQSAWKGLFEMDFGGNSPIEALKAQREAAIALVNQFKGDTKEVESFFDRLLSDAEATWQSLVDKEKEIFDERLTPAQRLENEKQEWIEKAKKWGMDAVNITKYYDGKIQEEIKKAEKERDDAAAKALEDFISTMEGTLDANEKLDELFHPVFMTDTAEASIQQDIDAVQRLYDTQMNYLNGLLETADLTEEEYAAVEERILSLTRTFNSQMEVLKEEQEYQGKNMALMTRKWTANMSLMEQATGDFASAFQDAGLENSVAFKGFATAQALISSFLAANRVLAEEPGGIIAKSVAAAAALAAGIANVVSIWKVNPDGSNAGSAMNAQAPQVPIIGDSTPYTYTRTIQTQDEEDRMNQPIWVSIEDISSGLGHQVQVKDESSF